jgi:hypothetical protein
MISEQLIAELTALREQHTLDEVLELVMAGLGGKEKVAAELEEYDEDEAGETETPDPLTVMRDADVSRLENIQTMAESFCNWLHAKGAQQRKRIPTRPSTWCGSSRPASTRRRAPYGSPWC